MDKVGIVLILDDPGFKSRPGQAIFLFSELSRLAVGLSQTSFHWVPEAIFWR
jgi:hypothetical protein